MEKSKNCTTDSAAISACRLPKTETKTPSFGNNYAKSNPNYLKSMFGRTDLMPLWIADMDFKVAKPITDELQRLVNRGNFAYESNSDKVFDVLVKWNQKRHGLKLESKSFIQVSGVLTGIGLMIRELSNEGDGIMIQPPVYHQFFKIIEAANRQVVENPLKLVNGNYEMDFANMEQQLKNQNIKIILLCNPHNPIGRVWKKAELQQLVALANKYDVRIISDEIHSDIIYSNSNFNSIASFADSPQHIAVIGSPAKTFGMQSISNGYLYIADADTHTKIKNIITSLYLDNGNALSTYATLAAYTYGEEWLNKTVVYLEETVNWVGDYLQKKLPEVKLIRPDGTYQIWLDFSALNLSAEALHQLMVHVAKLAMTPGTWFGNGGTQFMRMNIAMPKATIQQAFYQIKKAIEVEKTSINNLAVE
ncbi:MAG: MalY/PatB family protein [Chitinophagales bacterium]